MIPIHWSSQKTIPNLKYLVHQVETYGGSIIEYQQVWSLLVFSHSSPEYVWIGPGRSRFSGGLQQTVFSLMLGWWSLPGIIWTPAAVLYNCSGGADVTSLLLFLDRSTTPPPLPKRSPPPLPGTQRSLSQPPPLPAFQPEELTDADHLKLLRSLQERDRFRKCILLCGVGLMVLITGGGYLLSQMGHSKTESAPAMTKSIQKKTESNNAP